MSPGDILFVPAGWPHAVRNLPGPSTIAISANYVDGSNFQQHVQELRWQAMAERQRAHVPGADLDAGATQVRGENARNGDSEQQTRESRTASLLSVFESPDFDQSMQLSP